MDSKVAFGIVIIFSGLVQIVGAVTGNEAAMIAALGDPTLLSTSSGGAPAKPKTSSIVSGILGTLGNIASKVVP